MATRSKQKSTKPDPNKIAAAQRNCDNRVFLLDGEFTWYFGILTMFYHKLIFISFISVNLTNAPSEGMEILSLRNPSTEKISKYLYAKHTKQFFEILSFNEEPRSWFANDSVYPNGNIYMTSPFDPVFWALYYIRLNNVEKCQPIEQTIVDDNFSNAFLIADVLTVEQLAMVINRLRTVSSFHKLTQIDKPLNYIPVEFSFVRSLIRREWNR